MWVGVGTRQAEGGGTGRLGSPQGPKLGRVSWRRGLRKPDIQRVSCLLTLLRWLPGTRNLSELEINPEREVGS